jgi:serine/threonine protein kinase
MFSKYTLSSKIGQGGYSNVYKCHDKHGVQYACKKLPKIKNSIKQFNNEVDIMKSLVDCPNVMKIIESYEDIDHFYIIEEWCENGSLVDYINKNKVIENKVIIQIIYGIVNALHNIHMRGVIHCDVKANNVFIFDNNDIIVKLGDFGNSLNIIEDPIEVTCLSGTPHFMAPENLNHIYHRKSDVWSLGVLTYHLIYSKFPFDDHHNTYNPSILMLWKSIFQDDPTFTYTNWDGKSDLYKDFISKCLIKEYKSRPSSLECLEHPLLSCRTSMKIVK